MNPLKTGMNSGAGELRNVSFINTIGCCQQPYTKTNGFTVFKCNY